MRLGTGLSRSRWAAFGAAVAVTLGAGGVSWVGATISSGSKAVFVPITPCRLTDTRKTTPLTAGQTKTFGVHGTNGECTIPTGATAISGNITITDPTDDGFLTVAPAGAVGNSSNLNWLRGQSPTPNAFTVALSAGGAIDVRNDRGTVNVIIDVNGYYEDHNHDDRYYTKAQTDTALGAKANAADVYTKTQIDGSAAASVKAGGFIQSSGVVYSSSQAIGNWTVSKIGTGAYSVVLTNFMSAADCTAINTWPVVNVTAFSYPTAIVAQVTGMSTGACPSGGNLNFQVATRTLGGVATDSDWSFIVMKQNSSGLVPAEDGSSEHCTATAPCVIGE